MALQIRQHDKKWRILIANEEWEFEKLKEAKECLIKLLDYKEKKGEIPNDKRRI